MRHFTPHPQTLTAAVAIAALAFTPGAAAIPAGHEDARIAQIIQIEIDDQEGLLRVESTAGTSTVAFQVHDLRLVGGDLLIDGRAGESVSFSRRHLRFDQEQFELGELYIDSVAEEDGRVTARLANRLDSDARPLRAHRARVEVGRDLHVAADDFVLGDAICIGGDIYIDGEVRRTVLSFFGNIDVSGDARIHGAVAALAGRACVDRDARVRDGIFSTSESPPRHRRPARYDLDWDSQGLLDMHGYYNRVDGAWLGLQLTIADPDSVLPAFRARLGRSFMRDRWDYALGVHQRFLESFPITVGGRFYRELTSDDFWLAPPEETSLLALVAAEDYGDYYLEEGGAGFLTVEPLRDHRLGAGYRFAELSWIDHYPNLWHLFDAHKRFRPNYSSVPADSMAAGIGDFDSKLGELTLWYQFARVDDEADPRDGLLVRAEYRRAGDDLKGDHSYERYSAQLQRYQPLAQLGSLALRVKYGGSSGNLPLFRKFYLGGSRTIRSLDEKSLMGEQMILGNIEYIPHMLLEDFRPYVFYDVGKTTGPEDDIFLDGVVRSSIGLGLRLGKEIRVTVAKSLEDSGADPKLWVTFGKSF